MENIEKVRAQYESQLMAISGVVAVSVGLGEDGRPCLKIGTSVPAEEVRKQLPAGLAGTPVEVEFIGNIRAQPKKDR